MNPDVFLNLDRVIHEKGRLAIILLLAATDFLSFTEIRDILKMTDGNVSVHLKTLRQSEYVAITKRVKNRKPLTTVSMTEEGRLAFQKYLADLESIVQSSPFRSSEPSQSSLSDSSEFGSAELGDVPV
jgi:DNA-binding MarR family transcriptional regulator